MQDWKAMLREQLNDAGWRIPSEPEIEQSIEKIRQQRAKEHKFVWFFGISLVLMILGSIYMDNMHSRNPEVADRIGTLLGYWVLGPLFVLLLISALWSSFRNAGLICPCCGKSFYGRVLTRLGGLPVTYQNHFSRKCLHCGLKLNGSNITQARVKATERERQELGANE